MKRLLLVLLLGLVQVQAQVGVLDLADPVFLGGTVNDEVGGGGSVSFRAAQTSEFTSATASPTISYPTAVANDIWLCAIVTDTIHDSTGTPPTGWTKLYEVDVLTDTSTSVFWKRATGSEGASEEWTSIFAATERGAVAVVAYSGCTTSGSPIEDSAQDVSASPTNTPTTPSVTTSGTNRMIVGFFGADMIGGVTHTPNGSDNERAELQATGSLGTVVALDRFEASAGSYTLSATASAGTDTYANIGIALKP